MECLVLLDFKGDLCQVSWDNRMSFQEVSREVSHYLDRMPHVPSKQWDSIMRGGKGFSIPERPFLPGYSV